MVNLKNISSNLKDSGKGFWYSSGVKDVSYPEEGNEICFSVEDRSFWYQHRNQIIRQVVDRYPPAGPIFDVGGGNGVVSESLQSSGYNVVLVEPGKTGVGNATKRGLKHVVHSTLEDCGFHEESLSSVGLFDVLEHIGDDAGYLRSIRKLLVPGGRIYISVPAYPILWCQNDDHVGHKRRYSLASLNKLLVKAGFTVDYTTHFFSLLPLPIFLFRTVPYRLGIRKSISLETRKKEHGVRPDSLEPVRQWFLRKESEAIAQGKMIKFGSSCLAVASK